MTFDSPHNISALTQFSPSIIEWMLENTEKLEKKFARKFPRARNRFHLQLMNENGAKRVVVVNALGKASVDTHASYKNFLTWQSLREVGCPKN